MVVVEVKTFVLLCILTFHCFASFQIRDYQHEGEERNQSSASRSSVAFSIMCIFLTVLYAGFAALVFTFAHTVLEELSSEEALMSKSNKNPSHFVGGGYDGYIGGRFDIRRNPAGGFVAPPVSDGALT
jgi:hypothetical protein